MEKRTWRSDRREIPLRRVGSRKRFTYFTVRGVLYGEAFLHSCLSAFSHRDSSPPSSSCLLSSQLTLTLIHREYRVTQRDLMRCDAIPILFIFTHLKNTAQTQTLFLLTNTIMRTMLTMMMIVTVIVIAIAIGSAELHSTA